MSLSPAAFDAFVRMVGADTSTKTADDIDREQAEKWRAIEADIRASGHPTCPVCDSIHVQEADWCWDGEDEFPCGMVCRACGITIEEP